MALFSFIFMGAVVSDSERKNRRLFSLELRLKTKKKALLSQINPFSATHLAEWMQQREGRTSARRIRSGSVPYEAPQPNAVSLSTPRPSNSSTVTTASSGQEWQLDHADLQLVRRVAAGSAGVVWQGYYKRTLVAAKQL